jgi:hypothetical protein
MARRCLAGHRRPTSVAADPKSNQDLLIVVIPRIFFRMAELVVRGMEAPTFFSLLGGDENAATFALGWTLSRSDALLRRLISVLDVPDVTGSVRIELQRHGEDAGFTDIEIVVAGQCHVIVEAKVGGAVAGDRQLQRYRSRFADEGHNVIVSVSAAPAYAAARLLPGSIEGVPVRHLSWGDVRRMVAESIAAAAGTMERRWLRDLEQHLENYVTAQVVSSNLVYVVALSTAEIHSGYTWIDVVEKDGVYFHPIGRGGWPVTPPNYLGFRYHGQLQSVRHVENAEFVPALGERDERWAEWTDHILYHLGPPMRPAVPLRSGMTYANRVYCALDLLLSGACDTIKQAQEETARRLAG